jgi:c(7)-type cytochrome triheme protein
MRTIMRNKIGFILLLAGIAACFIPSGATAVQKGVRITFSGGGAGEVVFDGTVHAKELECADCHKWHFLDPPLYGKDRSAFMVSMRQMEMGRSCGHCHDVTSDLSCSVCHQNK